MDLVQWIPLLTALGAGTAIGNYIGAGKARREVRSAVLDGLTAVETKRWAPAEYSEFVAAARDIESAALVARVPRHAIRHYLVFADAARRLSHTSWEDRDGDPEMGAGGIDGYFTELVRDAAEVVTRLSWSPWLMRLRLPKELKKLRAKAWELAADDGQIKWRLASGQSQYGILPGPLGEIPGVKLPPFQVE